MSGRSGPAHPSRLELRASARTSFARFLGDLFRKTRDHIADVSEALGQGRDHPHIDRCMKLDDETQWQAPDSLLLEQNERDAVAEFIAGPTRMVVDRPHAEDLVDDLDRALDALEHATAALKKLKAGAKDGVLTRIEGREIREPAEAGARCLLSLAALGATAEREGVLGLPRASLGPPASENP